MCETICPVCFHHCKLKEGQVGLCHARKCENGASVCLNYGRATALALDPIEKKPLARFHPGGNILSIGSYGCNMACPFCQNAEISTSGDSGAPWRYVAPDALAELAAQLKSRGNIGAAFTYNEPMIGYEYVRDAAKAVKARGMCNVVVTNGMVSAAALSEVLEYIDAFNIDLKGFTDEWYARLGGNLQTVEDFIKLASGHSHVELTTLIVPGCNDSEDEMRALSEWVATIDPHMPLHITRFFPRHHMLDSAPTSIQSLEKLAGIARERLETVLIGNV